MKNTKRRKVKPKPKVELQTLSKPDRLLVWSRRAWIILFLLVLLFSLGLKIYKADYTGLIYDEVLTFQDYGHSFQEAVGSFKSTNNHILNSVFVYFGYTLFGSYIHFVRIFSLSSGILFSLSLAYVIYKTISSNALRVAALVWISFIPVVFDYTYYARGYAYMLAVMMLQFALILFLLEHKIHMRNFWIPALAFSLLNFLSLGALLSSVLLIAAMNLTFVCFYAPRIYRDARNRWQPIVYTGVTTALITFVLVFLLYHKVYDKIFENSEYLKISKEWHGWPTFVGLFRRVFLVQVFQGRLSWERYGWGIALILMGVAAGVCFYRFVRTVRHNAAKSFWTRAEFRHLMLLVAGGCWLTLIFWGVLREINLGTGAYKTILILSIFFSAIVLVWQSVFQIHLARNLILIVTVFCWLITIFYGLILDKSIGLVRNNVHFIPLMILSGAILADRWLGCVPKPVWRHVLTGVCFCGMIILLARNPVSPYYSYSRGASISRPLLRKLKELDPTKTWIIAFHPERAAWRLPFGYYGYHTKFYTHYRMNFRLVIPYTRGDVEIYPLDKAPPNANYLDRDYFAKANCAVVINRRPLPKPKPLPRRPPNPSKKPPSPKKE